MEVIELISQHPFLTIIAISIVFSGIKGIIYAIRGVSDEDNGISIEVKGNDKPF